MYPICHLVWLESEKEFCLDVHTMDKQVWLKSETVSVLVGQTPNKQLLDYLKDAYHNGMEPVVFRQVVVLSSRNLVQLCNFMKRCRIERSKGLQHRYLVILQFQPHRDSWRLLDVHKELGLTMILCNGPCNNFFIKELHPYATYILEWFKAKTYLKRPIIHVCKIQSKRIGVMRLFDNLMSTDEENIIDSVCMEWLATRNPLTNYLSADNFASMDNAARPEHFKAESFQQHSSAGARQETFATATMNIARACELLGITEAQSKLEEHIKKAYKRQAIRWHPDKQLGKSDDEIKEASSRFAEIAEANTYLMSLL